MEMSFPWLPSVSVDCVHSITASQRRISDSFTDNKQKKSSSLHWKQSIDEDQRLVDKSNTQNTTTAYLFSVCWVAEKSERCCCCCFSTYIECSWAHMHWTFLYIRLFTRHTYISSSTLVREKKREEKKKRIRQCLRRTKEKKSFHRSLPTGGKSFRHRYTVNDHQHQEWQISLPYPSTHVLVA